MRQTLHNTRPVKAKVHIIGGYGVPAVASYFFTLTVFIKSMAPRQSRCST